MDITYQPIPEVKRRLNTSERRELVKIARSNTQLGPRTVIVQPGDDIQNAIDSVANGGGGTVLLKEGTHTLTGNISGKTQVSIVGEGRDLSIVECGGNAYGLDYTGTSTTQLKNFKLADFTFQNSNNTAGIDIDYSDFWRMENVRIHSCDQKGLRVQRSQEFLISDIYASSNTGNGVEIIGDATSTRITQRFTLLNCRSGSNGGVGYSIQPSTNYMFYGNFIGCRADSNTGDGFDFTGVGSSVLDCVMDGCIASANGGIGFDVDSNCQRVTFIGCFADVNTGDGFEIAGTGFIIQGCYSSTLFDIQAAGVFVGNHVAVGSSNDPSSFMTYSNADLSSAGNRGGNTRTERVMMNMKNTSGGSLVNGDLVVLTAVAAGNEVTTTTTGGDDKVFGMINGSIANNAWGPVVVQGYTTNLKVDGTVDIAIGDFLTAFTTAKIAQKASAGDMCFGVALEAYTTNDSLGVIDALLFSPRLI
jgi:hypothetical protein